MKNRNELINQTKKSLSEKIVTEYRREIFIEHTLYVKK